jgi:hypothetical protein
MAARSLKAAMRDRMVSEEAACIFIATHSSSLSLPGLSRIVLLTPSYARPLFRPSVNFTAGSTSGPLSASFRAVDPNNEMLSTPA